MSDISSYAAATNPAIPITLLKDVDLSNKTSIYLTWPKSADTEILVTGYILLMAEGETNAFKVIYDGKDRS